MQSRWNRAARMIPTAQTDQTDQATMRTIMPLQLLVRVRVLVLASLLALLRRPLDGKSRS